MLPLLILLRCRLRWLLRSGEIEAGHDCALAQVSICCGLGLLEARAVRQIHNRVDLVGHNDL